MNPLARLSPALYAALAGLTVAGVPVPVYEHQAPAKAAFYVLLTRPGITGSGGRAACRQWSCEVVVQVVTRFATAAVSSAPADEVAEEVLRRLDGVALAMPAGWQCMPGRVAGADDGEGPTDPAAVVRRLRVHWEVYCHDATAVDPAPVAVAPPRETPGFLAALRGYFQGLF